MIPEFCLDDGVERLKRIVGVRYRSVGEIEIGKKHVQMRPETVICAPGPPVREERLAVIRSGLLLQKSLPAGMPILQHGAELLLVG